MADASGLLALGRALDEYLVGEYSPPPGTQTALGFLAGVPVSPVTFQNDGVVNPALVNAFLNLVVNKVAPVVDGRFAGSLLPAHQLFASLLAIGTPTAPPGTPAADAFAAMKTMAGTAYGVLGAPHDVVTAPSNWHDPVNGDGWATFSTTTSSSSGSSEGSSAGETPPVVAPNPRFEHLWQWRTLDPAMMAEVAMPAAEPPQPDPAPVQVGESVFVGALEIEPRYLIAQQALDPVVSPVSAQVVELVPELAAARPLLRRAALADRAVSLDAGAVSPRLRRPVLDAVAVDTVAVEPAVEAAPVAERAEMRVVAKAPRMQLASLVDADALLASPEDQSAKSQAMAEMLDEQAPVLIAAIEGDGETSSTQAVESNDLTLSLEYCFVQISRDAWWNDVLVRMPGWYAPGLRAGDLVPSRGLAGQPVGVPVAMVLTRDVRVTGRWSDADRAAAASHTSFGPWQLSESESSFEEHEESATLTIHGTQVVAVVCSLLSAIPPADDPALPAT
jgi:hypothetical protein